MYNIKWEPRFREETAKEVKNLIEEGTIGFTEALAYRLSDKIKKVLKVPHAYPTSNGTTALIAAIMAAEQYLGKDKLRIAVPNFSFIATANTPILLKHEVDFIDSFEGDWNINEDIFEQHKYTREYDVIICTDIGGFPCNYNYLKKYCKLLIADSAESVGSIYKGKYVGSQADIHCFSMHRAKVISSGEGGFVTTPNPDLHLFLKKIINHGYSSYKKDFQYSHSHIAANFRLSALHCSIALHAFENLDTFLKIRRENAESYIELFSKDSRIKRQITVTNKPNYFFFGITLAQYSAYDLCTYLNEKGIEAKTWTRVNNQMPYLNKENTILEEQTMTIDVSKFLEEHSVLLPVHQDMTKKHTKSVAQEIKEFLDGN